MKKNIFLLIAIVLIQTSCHKHGALRDNNASIKLIEQNSFEFIESNPIRMWTNDTCIMISGAPTNSIYIYTYRGLLIKKLGKAGNGPNENGTIWGFYPEEDFYWIYDYSKRAIKNMSYNGDSLIKSVKIGPTENICHIKNSLFLIPEFNETNKKYTFNILDIKKEQVIKEFDILKKIGANTSPSSQRLDFAYQGDFCKNKDGVVAYYCVFVGVFMVYNPRNDILKVYKDIRKQKLVDSKNVDGRTVVLNKNCGAMSAAIDSEFLYLMTPRTLESQWKYVDDVQIDVYKLMNGNYVTSFELPNKNNSKPRYISKEKNRLIVMYKDYRVVNYSIDDSLIQNITE